MRNIKISKISALLTLALVIIFLVPLGLMMVGVGDNGGVHYAQAQTYQFLEPIPRVGSELDMSSTSTFPIFVKDVITLIIGFAILAAVVMIVAAGLQYMTSRSQGGTGEAKERIQNAVLGLVLALASVVILQTINPQLIELKTVSTVTTSGSTFNIAAINEFGGQVINEEGEWKKQAGDKFCWRLEGEFWTVTGDRDQDLQICSRSEKACNDSRDAALEEYGDGWDGVDSECIYYYKSVGYIVDTETGEQFSETRGVGISTESKGQAQSACKGDVSGQVGYSTEDINTFFNNHPQCAPESGSRTITTVTDGDRCKTQCSYPNDPLEPPPTLPNNWDAAEYCPNTVPNNSSSCALELSACEASPGGTAGCYLTPTQMYGEDVGCTNCIFISAVSNRFKEGRFKDSNDMCSGVEREENRCRLDGGFLDKLLVFDGEAQAQDTLETFNYEITEVFPPTYPHAKDCHYDGTCADIGYRPTSERDGDNHQKKAEYIQKVFSAAEQSGIKACYEVDTQDEADKILEAAQNAGISSLDESNVIYVDGITANHFSVYKRANERCTGS